jgi:type I restriction enzyme S subunit
MISTTMIERVLTKSEAWVTVEPDGRDKQISARLWGKGLTLRGQVPGSAIAAPRQFCAKAGQFPISRIDGRHGAFGIIPDEPDGALGRRSLDGHSFRSKPCSYGCPGMPRQRSA